MLLYFALQFYYGCVLLLSIISRACPHAAFLITKILLLNMRSEGKKIWGLQHFAWKIYSCPKRRFSKILQYSFSNYCNNNTSNTVCIPAFYNSLALCSICQYLCASNREMCCSSLFSVIAQF